MWILSYLEGVIMKKLTAVTLSLCFALGAVACSGKTEASEAEETTVTSTSETSVEETESEKRETKDQPETVTATTETVNTDYVEPYINAVKEEAANEDGVTFDLIHIDEDDIPELVISQDGFWVSVYTWINGELKKPIDNWGYGIGGNGGYSYDPHKNVIHNFDADYAGALRTETLMGFDGSGEVEPISTGTLRFFEDEASAFDEGAYLDEPLLFINDKPVSPQEYYAVFFDRPQERFICGRMSQDEIIDKLQKGEIPEEHSYEIITADVTWSEAAELARANGGYLATLTDSVEYYLVFTMFSDYNMVSDIFIVGASRDENNGYVWSEDGSNIPLDDSLWRQGEPSFEGFIEGGNTKVMEDKVVMLNGQYMDVPDDLIGAAPSYSGSVSYIVEYDHCS